MKLSMLTECRGDVVVVHCQGRIVHRDEAAALSVLVGKILGKEGKVILNLGEVSFVDCTGIGELVLLQSRARSRRAELKCAGAAPHVRRLMDLTRVDSCLDLHGSLDEALKSFDAMEVEAETACVGL